MEIIRVWLELTFVPDFNPPTPVAYSEKIENRKKKELRKKGVGGGGEELDE